MNPKTKKNPHEYLVLHIAKAKDEFAEEIERLRKELAEVKRTHEESSDAFNSFIVKHNAAKQAIEPTEAKDEFAEEIEVLRQELVEVKRTAGHTSKW